MQRKTRIVLRAVRILRREAREYIEDAKSGSPDERRWLGRKAAIMLGTSIALEKLGMTGEVWSSHDEKKYRETRFKEISKDMPWPKKK